MKVTPIAHSGDDLLVVNAARVSMAKKSQYKVTSTKDGHPVWELSDKDKKLIKYLARHNHWTPFGHCYVTLHVKVPIFVARQLMRSNVGIVYNEVSRRYVDTKPEFWWPKDGWRKRAANVKQGSSDEVVIGFEEGGTYISMEEMARVREEVAVSFYEKLLRIDVAPELARIVLPQNMYTEFYMSGTLAAFARVCKLRLDPHAQKEIREVAQQISDIMKDLYPVSWEALLNNEETCNQDN